MAHEFSNDSDNYINQSPTAENLTSSIFFDEVAKHSKAVRPDSQPQSKFLEPGSPIVSKASDGSPITYSNSGTAAEKSTPGDTSGAHNSQLTFKDDSLFCGKSSSEDAAYYLNWNMVPEAVQTIDFCQSMASNPDSFSNFMEDVVKHDSFWGAEIELEYSTDKIMGTKVSGFTIKQ